MEIVSKDSEFQLAQENAQLYAVVRKLPMALGECGMG